jgi:hypothetical protein
MGGSGSDEEMVPFITEDRQFTDATNIEHILWRNLLTLQTDKEIRPACKDAGLASVAAQKQTEL